MYTERKLKELFKTKKNKEGMIRLIKSNAEAFLPLLQLSLKKTCGLESFLVYRACHQNK
jgi:hypothetical protein